MDSRNLTPASIEQQHELESHLLELNLLDVCIKRAQRSRTETGIGAVMAIDPGQYIFNQFPPPEMPNGAEILISAPFSIPDSEAFQHVRDQRPGKVAAQPIQCRRALLKKRRQVGGGLILLPEYIVLVLVKNSAVPPVQRDGNHHG